MLSFQKKIGISSLEIKWTLSVVKQISIVENNFLYWKNKIVTAELQTTMRSMKVLLRVSGNGIKR